MILILDNYDSFTYNLYQMLSEHTNRQVVVIKHDALTAEQVMALNPKAIVISPGPGTPDEAGISLSLIQAASGKIPILGICLGHQCIAQAFGGKIIKAPTLIHGKVDHIITLPCDPKPPVDPVFSELSESSSQSSLSDLSGLAALPTTHHLFKHLPPNFIGVRYHSLAVSLDDSVSFVSLASPNPLACPNPLASPNPSASPNPFASPNPSTSTHVSSGVLIPLAYAASDSCLMALKHRDHPTLGLQFHPESFGTQDGHQLLKNFLEIMEAYHDQSLIQTHIS